MYKVIKPKKFSIYVTSKTNKMLASKVRQLTGADIVINGSLFEYDEWVPDCDVKANGKILKDDKYTFWGYGWNNADSKMTMTNNMYAYQNYISCVALIKDGVKLSLKTVKPDVAGPSGRTGIGWLKDGSMIVWCTKDDTANMTISQFQDKMYSLGCVNALNLDGGGSSQLSQNGSEYVYSTRCVQNYLCIWLEDESDKTVTNPYNIPSTTLKKGSYGDGVRWLQSQLNIKGSSLVVDGDFGPATYTAVLAFQKEHGLSVDGIVGSLTRAKLLL